MRLLACAFILLLASYDDVSASPDIEEAFSSFMIVPTTLSAAPENLLTLRFGDISAKLGNVIEPSAASWPPTVTYEADPNGLYTMLILDLFKPSLLAPDTTSYLFMLVVNIPGNNAIAGDVVSPYVPPSPIPGTGYHYYVYLVYRQPFRIDTNEQELLDQPGDYTTFLLPEFTERYNLTNPVAGNFFLSRASVCKSHPPRKLAKCG